MASSLHRHQPNFNVMTFLHRECLSWRRQLSYGVLFHRISCRGLRTHKLSPRTSTKTSKSPWFYPISALLLGGASWTAYENSQPFRHTILATVRCTRVGGEFILFRDLKPFSFPLSCSSFRSDRLQINLC